MAEKKVTAKKRQIKKTETVRERAQKSNATKKPRRIRRAGTSAAKPLKAAARIGRKEFYLPLPDTKLGKFLNKKRSFMPKYFKLSWQELVQVKWPNRKETIKLSFAVFLFALFIGTFITLADFILDKIFKNFFLK